MVTSTILLLEVKMDLFTQLYAMEGRKLVSVLQPVSILSIYWVYDFNQC